MTLPLRQLGSQGLQVSALGLGCMGLTFAYGRPEDRSDAQGTATVQAALELGVTFFDTAEVYGPHTNEVLIGKALRTALDTQRDRVVIASKFGFRIDASGNSLAGVDSRPENVKSALDGCLKRLGVDYIDLWYQHRVDPAVPIEDTVGAMAECVKAGKVKYLGLSEASPKTIRRAHAVHPISALQSEYSLFERGVEREVLPTLRELGIGFVPYSPLGRGILTGNVKRAEDYAKDGDTRQFQPRLAGENYDANRKLFDALAGLAGRKRCTPAQLALAWLLQQGNDIVPIPGTTKRARLEENLGALQVSIAPCDQFWFEENFPRGAAKGDRYTPAMLKLLDR
jgi:aryl-alcohol dehydrogenase-like predicted oxidoreductase